MVITKPVVLGFLMVFVLGLTVKVGLPGSDIFVPHTRLISLSRGLVSKAWDFFLISHPKNFALLNILANEVKESSNHLPHHGDVTF